MPPPVDRAREGGHTSVYVRVPQPGGATLSAWSPEPDWRVDSVELGSRDRLGTANLSLNRDAILRGDIPEFTVDLDAQYLITYTDSPAPTTPEVPIFLGVPANLNRLLTGQTGASADTGTLELVEAATLYDAAPESQIFGRAMAAGHDPTTPTGTIVDAFSLPCIFNAGGLPNRSVQTAHDSGMFGTADDADIFYFLADNEYGYFFDGSTGGWRSRRARYWTYAQAIAYVLHFWAGAPLATTAVPQSGGTNSNTGAVRNLVALWFGNPAVAADPSNPLETGDLLWHVLFGTSGPFLYKEEPLGFVAENDNPNPQLPPFDIKPSTLLRRKVNNISIEGLTVLEALAVLLHAAGMGWWIDHNGAPINGLPPDPMLSLFKVWTPGGQLNSQGLGGLFYPNLQPYGTDVSQQAIEDTLALNTAKDLNLNWDGTHVINAPIVVGSPEEYEITAELRPGWLPIHDQNILYLDNIDPSGSIEEPTGQFHNELSLAFAEAHRAFSAWLSNPDFYTDFSGGSSARVRFLSRILHAKGDLNPNFPDILRKWILPTDHRYPDDDYKRDTINLHAVGMPTYYGTYAPVNFNNVQQGGPIEDLFMFFPIIGSDTWPDRPYPIFPMLTTDRMGTSLGVIVELSFDRGENWQKWPSFTVLPDEFGIALSFENPFDVTNNRKLTLNGPVIPWQQSNLVAAYMTYNFRIRVTGTIRGGESLTQIGVAQPPGQQRSTAILRRSRYRKTALLSQNFGLTIEDPAAIVGPINPLAPKADHLVFKAVDDTLNARLEADTAAAMGANVRLSSAVVIPWIETDATPGKTVPFLNSLPAVGSPDPAGRQLDFRQQIGAKQLGPAIAGVVYTFAAGGQSTQLILEDWRTVAAIGEA